MARIIRKSSNALAPLLAFAVLLSGCATAPYGQKFEQSASTTKVSSVRQEPELHQNEEVSWGGSVIGINNREGETWIEIIDRPLDQSGIPNMGQKSAGRFLAIVPGFLDPLDYSNGRSITITGTVNGSETRKIAEADYDYPIVAVVNHQLWTEAQASSTRRGYNSGIYYPYYGYYRHPYRSRYGIGYGLLGYSHYGYGYGRYGYRGHRYGRYGYGRHFGGFRSGIRNGHRGTTSGSRRARR